LVVSARVVYERREMRIWIRVACVGFLAAGVASLALACGTDAVGVSACRSIETARCEAAPACGISLALPVHIGDDVSACVRFYNDQCLHGLVTQSTPSTVAVNACVAAIQAAGALAAKKNTSACLNTVQNPQNTAACAFLNPGPDASVEDAGEDASDASDDAG
jgi:hypothetical protein